MLRVKRIATAVLPASAQVALKRPYYLWALRHAQMEDGSSPSRPTNAAASDREGSVTMEVPRYRRGPEALTDARIVERPTSLRHFMVAAMRIDSLKLSRLDFVKMDVEGHEIPAVRGALGTTERFRPAMIIESVLAEGEWLYPILEPLGYRGFVWRDGAFRLTGPSERSQNVFFLMPHHAS